MPKANNKGEEGGGGVSGKRGGRGRWDVDVGEVRGRGVGKVGRGRKGGKGQRWQGEWEKSGGAWKEPRGKEGDGRKGRDSEIAEQKCQRLDIT